MPEMFDDEERDETQPEEPSAEETPAEEPAAEEQPATDEPVAEEAPATEEPPQGDPVTDAEPEAEAGKEPAAEEPAAEEAPAEDAPAETKAPEDRGPTTDDSGEAAIPGAHLEPDLVLDEAAQAREDDPYAEPGDDAEGDTPGEGADEAPAPISAVLELAADARYIATGKRKSAVARVIIKPGSGSYSVNGRELAEFFPRPTLQRVARGPLETVGHEERMDVVAKIHGGGVSSQAGALRHGIARALVEADPNLRGELKRRGYLTRDPRVKERKKAGLKKARKRPQFSKR
jgi:small subunit ribosomal protein S9